MKRCATLYFTAYNEVSRREGCDARRTSTAARCRSNADVMLTEAFYPHPLPLFLSRPVARLRARLRLWDEAVESAHTHMLQKYKE